MELRQQRKKVQLTAVTILVNRELSKQFFLALPDIRVFHILAELKSYPPLQTLDVRIRQLRPDLVFVDLSADLDQAVQIVQFLSSFRPPIYIVALNVQNDPEAILRSVRAGAREYLYSPFDAEMQQEAIQRILKLRQIQPSDEAGRAKVLVFTSAKPGSGASTLASQTAFAIRRLTGARVLLVDLDLWGGTISFFFKLHYRHSVVDALRNADRLDDAEWTRLAIDTGGVDVLPAPEAPSGLAIEPARLHDMFQYAVSIYDWVIADLPSVFERVSLLAITDSDSAFLVTTPELPSLHLTRKAVAFLAQLGVGERFHVLVNRVSKRDGISRADMEKIFNSPVHATFPNDYLSLHHALAEGRPLAASCDLGKTIADFAAVLTVRGSGTAEKQKANALC